MVPADVNKIQELIRLAQHGDQAAFTQFYHYYVTPVYRYVYVRVHDTAMAEDLTQQVFVNAFSHLDGMSKKESKPLAYLYTIARNLLIDFWKKRKEVHQTDVPELFEKTADTDKGPNEIVEQREFAERVRTALAYLSAGQRDAVSLKYLNDFSTTEIAKHIGKSEEAVRQLLSRGLRALRKYIS